MAWRIRRGMGKVYRGGKAAVKRNRVIAVKTMIPDPFSLSHVRFDERRVEPEHGGLLGHRHTKEPATRKASPKPPRHSSTLLLGNVAQGGRQCHEFLRTPCRAHSARQCNDSALSNRLSVGSLELS